MAEDELAQLRLDAYEPTELGFGCRRCDRRASASTQALKAKYGNPTLGDLARLVAADGSPPCNLAGVMGQILCTAIPIEPPVSHWASLSHAMRGGWNGWLFCERRHAGLKATKSCPGPIRLHVPSLIAALHYDFKLERLPSRLECPDCSGKLIRIEWEVPPPSPPNEPLAFQPRGEPASGETLHRPAKPVRSSKLRVINGSARDPRRKG